MSKADYKRVRTNIALLKSEKAVSEYHLSLELESDTRDMYWPGNMIDYSSVSTEISSYQPLLVVLSIVRPVS